VTPALLGQLADEMRTNHFALKAAQARWDAAQAEVKTVRTWEDPTVRAGFMFSDEGMRADEGDIIYGVEQKLPLWGKPRLERARAEAQAAREQSDLDFQFQQRRRDLAKIVFGAAQSSYVLEIGEEDLAWLGRITASLEQRYQAGEVAQVWVLRAQNDRARRAEQLRTDRQRLEHDWVSLNRLLNREPQSPWPRLALPEPAGPVVFNDRLVGLAWRGEPRLKLYQKEIEQAEAGVAVVRARAKPDVMAGVVNRNYSGNAEWRQTELMVGLNLPLWNRGKYRSEIQRESARVGALQHERDDYRVALREEVHALTVRIDAARREALLYRNEIVPRSAQAVAGAEALWTSGRGMFLDLLEARRMWLEARLMYARAVSEQYMALSELALCCGLGELESLSMIDALPPSETETNSVPKQKP
jgi:outer membrane protein TolC